MSSISSPMEVPIADEQNKNFALREKKGVAYIALLFFLFFMCAALQSAFPQIDVIKPAQLTAATALIAAVMGKFSRHEPYVMRWPSYLVLIFMGFTGLSVIGALWPREALNTALDALKTLAIFLLISNVVLS